jgi:hypothetical protein
MQFGHLEAGFHFVPEGRPIVARRFIAGLAIHRICVPEGRLNSDIYRSSRREIFAPKGLEDSAQGFNPGNRPPRATRPDGAAVRTY